MSNQASLYIDPVSGNVGIGTSAPAQPLHIRANTASTAMVIDQVGSGAILDIRDGGVSKVVVDANGNVGIGVPPTPLAPLYVGGNMHQSWGDLRFGIFYDNSFRQGINYYTTPRQLNIFSCSGDIGGDITFSTIGGVAGTNDNNYGTQRMIIRGNGYVGIGTTNPTAKMHLLSSDYITATFENNTQTYPGQIIVKNSYYNNQIQIRSKFLEGASISENHIFTWNGSSIDKLVLNNTMTIFGNSMYVGIAYTNPQFPLHVGIAIPQTLTGFYFNYGNPTTAITNGNFNVSIKAEWYIWTTYGFVASSDARIKTNIQNINDETALNQLRLLKPKTYEYIDKVQKGQNTVNGFIAQEVADVLPYAVTKQKEIIPSIYAIASVVAGVLTLEKLHDLAVGDKVKLIKEQGGEVITKVKAILSTTSFTVEEIIEDARVFVYGKEVDDFHTLDKNAIFTIGVAAVQELDRQVQFHKERLADLEARLAAMEEKLNSKSL
jgi:hypothetical protein